MINRRGFLAGILVSGIAPAFVGAKILMPVKIILVQEFWNPYLDYEDYSAMIARIFKAHRPQLIANLEANNTLLRRLTRP